MTEIFKNFRQKRNYLHIISLFYHNIWSKGSDGEDLIDDDNDIDDDDDDEDEDSDDEELELPPDPAHEARMAALRAENAQWVLIYLQSGLNKLNKFDWFFQRDRNMYVLPGGIKQSNSLSLYWSRPTSILLVLPRILSPIHIITFHKKIRSSFWKCFIPAYTLKKIKLQFKWELK